MSESEFRKVVNCSVALKRLSPVVLEALKNDGTVKVTTKPEYSFLHTSSSEDEGSGDDGAAASEQAETSFLATSSESGDNVDDTSFLATSSESDGEENNNTVHLRWDKHQLSSINVC